jgi:hypothetical protein
MSNPWRHVMLIPLLPALAACMTHPAPPIATRDGGEQIDAKTFAARQRENYAGRTGKRTAIPIRALNVTAQCDFKDEMGTSGNLALSVEDASVKQFTAQVNIPKRGVCNFDLARFHQTSKLPTPVLSDGTSSCRVYVWEQGNAVTVAFNACRSYCTANAYDYLWPILVDRKSGTCT